MGHDTAEDLLGHGVGYVLTITTRHDTAEDLLGHGVRVLGVGYDTAEGVCLFWLWVTTHPTTYLDMVSALCSPSQHTVTHQLTWTW